MNYDYFQEDKLEELENTEYEQDDEKSCGCEDGEHCPLCCSYPEYQPGCEDCDFCAYSEECEKDFEERCKHLSTNKAER